jgi:hypothetical protein
VVAAGPRVVVGPPNAPVVTVGAGSFLPPRKDGTTRASTITTAAPISTIPTGWRYQGGGAPGGRGALGCSGDRWPQGSLGVAGAPQGRGGGGSCGGCGRRHGCPPHGWGWGGCSGGCSTRSVSLVVPGRPGTAGLRQAYRLPGRKAPKLRELTP